MKKFLFCILSSIVLVSCETNDSNIKTLNTVLKLLKSGQYDKNKLYLDHFMQISKEGYDRSEAEKIYYKDTLFKALCEELIECTDYRVLPIEKARQSIGDSIIKYNYYYETQKDAVYVITIDNKKRRHDIVQYCLVVNGKIVSLVPQQAIDNEIIKWR